MTEPEIQRTGEAPTGARDARFPFVFSDGCLGKLLAAGTALIGGVYLANPTFGLFEMIPDAIPGFGNLDEATVTAFVILALRSLFGRPRPPKP